jgi:hypothetical protein
MIVIALNEPLSLLEYPPQLLCVLPDCLIAGDKLNVPRPVDAEAEFYSPRDLLLFKDPPVHYASSLKQSYHVSQGYEHCRSVADSCPAFGIIDHTSWKTCHLHNLP